MKKLITKKLILAISAALILALASICYYGTPTFKKPEYITILHSNDIHGRLEPFQYKDNNELVGGLARRETLIEQIEGTNKCALTVDAGDIAQGSLFFNLFKGIPDVKLMSQAGYDVSALGNHEFDRGVDFLKNMIKNADFPFISANIRFTDDPELQSLVRPYIIKDCHGLKVAFIGLMTPELIELTNVKGIEIKDNIAAAKDLVKKLNSKADMLVVLSHSGISEDLKLAKNVPEIDVIIGGHSHTLIKEPKLFNKDGDKTLVLQAGEYGTHLGRLDVKIRGKKIENYYYELIPVNEEIEPDINIKNKIAILSNEIQKYTGELIGQLADPIGLQGEKIRSELLPAGSLVTESIKNSFPSVDIVLQNSGGIRPYKQLGPGAVTLADVMRLFPFDNTIVTLELSGELLKSVLERSSSLDPDDGGFLQSLGLEYTITANKPQGSRVSEIKVNGKPLDNEKYYKIATNNYIFHGGNGYSQFKEARNAETTNIPVQETIVKYIKQNSPVSVQVKDRINIVE